ncbi:putative uncharacterized protein DDB_G0294196 [Mytilus trossulus]|uniref:putative uncharacterized protein DDB_G0294196 n=1 Tax=Mytilus trossulus TaxID=6551 RepID=UPI0030055271
MAQFAFKSCDICMSGPGKSCCKQCNQWLCDYCKTLHLRSKISRNHTFFSGESINPDDNLSCREHEENFIFYCIDCEIPICKMCIVNKHKKHDTSEINESIQGLQAEVKQVTESKITSAKTNLNKIKQSTDKYHSDIIEALRAITEDGNEIKQEVDQQILALKESLEKVEAENIQALEPIRNELQNDIEKLEKCQNDLAESQKITDIAELLKSLKQIKSDIDDTKQKEPPIMPTVKYAKKDRPEKKILKYFGEISVKEIKYSTTLQKSQSEQNQVMTTGSLAKFTMQQPPPPRPQPPQPSSPPPPQHLQPSTPQQLQPSTPPSSQHSKPPPLPPPPRPQPPQPSSPSPQQQAQPSSPKPPQQPQSPPPPRPLPPQPSSQPPQQQPQPSSPQPPQQPQSPPPPRSIPPKPSLPSPQQQPYKHQDR